jgi:hypothetical protein
MFGRHFYFFSIGAQAARLQVGVKRTTRGLPEIEFSRRIQRRFARWQASRLRSDLSRLRSDL